MAALYQMSTTGWFFNYTHSDKVLLHIRTSFNHIHHWTCYTAHTDNTGYESGFSTGCDIPWHSSSNTVCGHNHT